MRFFCILFLSLQVLFYIFFMLFKFLCTSFYFFSSVFTTFYTFVNFFFNFWYFFTVLISFTSFWPPKVIELFFSLNFLDFFEFYRVLLYNFILFHFVLFIIIIVIDCFGLINWFPTLQGSKIHVFQSSVFILSASSFSVFLLSFLHSFNFQQFLFLWFYSTCFNILLYFSFSLITLFFFLPFLF